MSQDTRKDPRVKVPTMIVRYKSATVDEFVEHHSMDVSRGGMFIKTPQAFAPGTLLKFEVRIAEEKAMIQGVGRVVWKREPGSAAEDRPAGMGVKFIRIDDASKALIDRLVEQNGGAPTGFESEQPVASIKMPAAAPVSPPISPPAPPGTVPPPPAFVGEGAPALSDSMAKLPTTVSRKGTVIGLGGGGGLAAAAAAAAAAVGAEKPASEAPPMFPAARASQPAAPPAEPTVLKQAAELLQEALKGAGGSLEEIGSTPLVDVTGHQRSEIEEALVASERLSVAGIPIAASASTRPMAAAAPSTPIPPSDDPETAGLPTSVGKLATGKTFPAPAHARSASPMPPPSVAPGRSGGGARMIVYGGVLLAVAVIGYFVAKDWETKPPTASAPPAPIAVAAPPAPAPSPEPSASAAPAPAASASAAPATSASAAPAAPASAAPTAATPTVAPVASAEPAPAVSTAPAVEKRPPTPPKPRDRVETTTTAHPRPARPVTPRTSVKGPDENPY